MDKNKQMKKCKLKSKLISIAMLATILLTMLAVPTSAVENNGVIGKWVINMGDLGIASDFFIQGEFRFSYVEKGSNTVIEEQANTILFKSGSIVYVSVSPSTSSFPRVHINSTNCLVYYNTNDLREIKSTDSYFTECRTIDILSVTASTGDLESWLNNHATKVIPPIPEPDPLGNILDVFLGIGGWIATAVTSLIGIFYSAEAGKLTVIGVLSVASLAISVIFLLIGVIQNFMHFRS